MDGRRRRGPQKTYAFATDRSRKQSGWVSDTMLYSTVPARTVLSNTDFRFARHNFDEPGVEGSYYASHVEPQALYDAREDAAILVTRPMCKSCEEFVPYLARARNINVHVGTPEGIVTVSNDGSFRRTESVSGTASPIWWQMSHDRAQGLTRMQLIHPNRNTVQTDISVSGSSGDPEGPVAVEYHRHDDGMTERTTYFESKDVDIQTLNISGPQHRALTHVGRSGGVQDSLTYGDHTTGNKRVPKKELGRISLDEQPEQGALDEEQSAEGGSDEEQLEEGGSDEEQLEEGGSDDESREGGSDEQLEEGGSDEEQAEEGGSDEQLEEGGSDEEQAEEGGSDEQLEEGGWDEEQAEEGGSDEESREGGSDDSSG